MKKKAFLLLILILLITGCGYDEYETPEDVTINLNDNVLKVFSNNILNDLISDSNVEITNKMDKINTDKIGSYTYTIKYNYKKRKYKYDITYTVIDDTPPVFIGASNSITMAINDTNKDICNKIVYGDNYDNLVKCTINGNYDTDKIGTYKDLEYVITDSSLNENKKKFTLNVVKEIKSNNTNKKPTYLYMNDIINKYKNDNTVIGIDVSKWQGNVNFKRVKDSGIDFVIMRIGRQNDANEDIDVDSKFEEYYKSAKEAGLKIGVYLYNVSISEEDGIKAAKWIIKKLDGEKLDLPIAYDWENWQKFNKYNISLHTLSNAYLAFERTLKDNGYDAMLYSSKFYLENVWMNYDNSNVWLAHYTSKTDYEGDYMLWQMTSLAKVNGITDNTVDIDILYKDKYEIK